MTTLSIWPNGFSRMILELLPWTKARDRLAARPDRSARRRRDIVTCFDADAASQSTDRLDRLRLPIGNRLNSREVGRGDAPRPYQQGKLAAPSDDRRATLLPIWTRLLLCAIWFSCDGVVASEPHATSERGPATGQESASLATQSTTERKTVVLDLSRKETYVRLSGNFDPQDVLITDVQISDLPSAHWLIPESGHVQLGRPLDVSLKEVANVRIHLAIVKRGKDLALRVSPQIVLGQNNTIDLTHDRVTRTARSLQRRVRDLSRRLGALSNERQALNLWLLTPVNKPLDAVKVTRLRIKLLDRAIKTHQSAIPVARSQCAIVGQAAAFVRKLHKNVEIGYSVKFADQDEE